MARRQSQGCAVDMTPMIDVVFQLIIFFIVTMKMEQDKAEIELEMSPNGPPVESQGEQRLLEIEVDRRGWISIKGAQLSAEKLKRLLRDRYRKYGEFPVVIRGDWRTQHRDIRSVMDLCSGAGLWRINFLAIKERRSSKRAFDL